MDVLNTSTPTQRGIYKLASSIRCKQETSQRKIIKQSRQPNCSKKKKMAPPTYSTSTEVLFLLMTAYTLILQINAQTCKCLMRNVDFSTCNRGQAEYRNHDHPDIGLVGSCLPQVPAK
jgi:hypothetical protein